jgi:hypothetical protein
MPNDQRGTSPHVAVVALVQLWKFGDQIERRSYRIAQNASQYLA